MTDIVDRLRNSRRVSQFDSAGRLITFEAEPTGLEVEAAAEIERLRALTTWRTVDENTPRDGRKLCMWAPGFGLGALTLYWMDGNWREPKDGCGLKVEPTHWLPVIPPDGGGT